MLFLSVCLYIKLQFSSLNIYWDGHISLGPQRRGCHNGIICARVLLGEMLVREKAGRRETGEGARGVVQAAHLSLGEEEAEVGFLECPGASVRYEHSHQRRPAPQDALASLSRNSQSGPCSSGTSA